MRLVFMQMCQAARTRTASTKRAYYKRQARFVLTTNDLYSRSAKFLLASNVNNLTIFDERLPDDRRTSGCHAPSEAVLKVSKCENSGERSF